MTENEFCINVFVKWNISKKFSYIVGNNKFFGKICILDLRNKRKSIFTRVTIRNWTRQDYGQGNGQDYN